MQTLGLCVSNGMGSHLAFKDPFVCRCRMWSAALKKKRHLERKNVVDQMHRNFFFFSSSNFYERNSIHSIFKVECKCVMYANIVLGSFQLFFLLFLLSKLGQDAESNSLKYLHSKKLKIIRSKLKFKLTLACVHPVLEFMEKDKKL